MATWELVNTGEEITFEAVLNKAAQSSEPSLRLFKNNATISDTTVAGDLTVADFTGYANIECAGSNWTISGGSASFAQQTFTSSAGSQNQDIYGAYIMLGAVLWAAVKFDASVNIAENGDNIKITPDFALD